MKTKVVIVSGIQLINNPRVFKEAKCLSENGFEVTVLASVYNTESRILTEKLLQGTQFHHLVVFDGVSSNAIEKIKVFGYRAIGRLARILHSILGWESPLQLGNQVIPLLLAARRQQADLFIVHLEQALFVGCKLLDEGRNVAIDVEDWYSEDGLPEDRMRRPLQLIRSLELKLLQNCPYSTTTSQALSKQLAAHYQCSPPGVVFNAFVFGERDQIDYQHKDRCNLEIPSIVWFSQTVGPGRGLEQLVEAVNHLEFEVEVHILGTCRTGFKEDLLAALSEEKKGLLFFHPPVPQQELLSRLAEHDIGFAGELSYCKSRDLTVTNKALEYMRAGLGVVASDTAGHCEIAAQTIGFQVYQQTKPDQLAEVISDLVVNTGKLSDGRSANLELARNRFSWEITSQTLLDLVMSATHQESQQQIGKGYM